MKLSKSKILKHVRFKVIVIALASLFISLLALLIENDGGSTLLFLSIGIIVLILAYNKVKVCLKILETRS
jgi:cell division protein FtsW (lipid II flippase)